MMVLSGPIVLIDTCGAQLMVGIRYLGRSVYEYTTPIHSQRTHSSLLLPVIRQGIETAGLNIQDVRAFAVSHGPGSFTGIRTGVTAVRVLAQFLNSSVYQMNVFECLLAAQGQECAVALDARQGNIYFAVLRLGRECIEYLVSPKLCPMDELVEWQTLPWIVDASLLPSLQEKFPGKTDIRTRENSQGFTPDAMYQLIQRYGQELETTWQTLTPLYLQQPNITLRKAKSPGRFR